MNAAAIVPPQSEREVLRTAVEQPFDPREHPSPLSGFRSYLEPAKADEPMLTVSGLGADRRLRIATLDTYDGVTYSVGSGDATSPSGSFTRVPYRIDQSKVRGTETSIEVMNVSNGYISLTDGTTVPSGGTVPLPGTACMIAVTSGGDEATTGFAEIRVTC